MFEHSFHLHPHPHHHHVYQLRDLYQKWPYVSQYSVLIHTSSFPFTQFNWEAFMKLLFDRAQLILNTREQVLVRTPAYFDHLGFLIKRTLTRFVPVSHMLAVVWVSLAYAECLRTMLNGSWSEPSFHLSLYKRKVVSSIYPEWQGRSVSIHQLIFSLFCEIA